MSEWKFIKLQEVLDFGNGKVKPQNEGNIPIYGGNGILGYGDDFNYSGETIIIGRVGAYCGSVYYENRPIWISDNALSAKPKGDNNAKFLYYFLKNSDLNQWAGGSSHPLVTQTLLNSLEFSICVNPKVQVAIASVLSSLDDKIDLLHRQNATLEKMAETLFRQWFVERCPEPVEGEEKEEWKIGKITHYASHVKDSIHPQKNQMTLYHHYSIPAFDNGKNPVEELGGEIKSNKYKVPEYCILFSKLNPHKDKRVWLLQNEVETNPICSTEFQIVLPKNKKHLYFLYGWLSLNENYNEIASGVGGTSGSHQRIDPNTIFDFECPLVTDDIVERFNAQVEPLFKKQLINQTQIRTLTSLRDTLLPKLMSGEVRVEM